MSEANKLLLEAFRARNELYQRLLGNYASVSPADYCAPEYANTTDLPLDTNDPAKHIDNRLAVLTYAPDPFRHYWTHLTAGLSSPWLQDEPAEVSGFGCELMLKSPEAGDWPAQLLRAIAYNIFCYAGTASPGVRLRLNAPVSYPAPSKLTSLLVWYADEAPDAWYQLPSGGFGIFALVGMTDDELDYAESYPDYGTWCIQQLLRQTGVGQVTDPGRASVMDKDNIQQTLATIKQYIENFRTLC